MSGKIFNTILSNINMVLKREGLKEYDEEDFTSKLYERYIIFCKSRNLNPVVKSIDKFSLKLKTFLSKDKNFVQLFFDNYFTDDLNNFYYNFNLSLSKPKPSKEDDDKTKKEEKVKEIK